ncbi:30S ribosomal protein S6 [Melittangium boletus]|uniref:Small ribosomal subunit protein bS6 n=1 Tax=Melittangium boletus DSM 14713 TaxID=1294270 RepID=A0A250IKB4_9BACT|nr:30S ribosomal protein S6 [Melittangium boletus]ATB32209.1 30S ribosomal protein S6 [Melittangium boletus DSM 14713]
MAETQAAKRLREYETIFLVKPDLTDDNVDKLKERVRGIVGREGGKVIRFTVWGKKKTLYPIAKQPRAIYIHAHYLGGTKLVAEIERNLRNLDEVTRYLSTKIAEEVDPETRPVLEDVKLAGDVEETRPGIAAPERAGSVEESAEAEEESTEEA